MISISKIIQSSISFAPIWYFSLNDNKTEVKVSFDLSENNITVSENVSIDIEKFDYEEDGIWAKILKVTSNTKVNNVDVEIIDNANLKRTTNTVKKITIPSVDKNLFI